MRNPTRAILAPVIAIALALVGCDDAEREAAATTSPLPCDTVRVAHADHDGPPLSTSASVTYTRKSVDSGVAVTKAIESTGRATTMVDPGDSPDLVLTVAVRTKPGSSLGLAGVPTLAVGTPPTASEARIVIAPVLGGCSQ